MAALQNGAKLFVNYCLNCHSATYMRYNRLHDIGLTDDEIKKNLLFATDKVGDTMKIALDPKQAKDWFGAAPPDLSVIARSRAEAGKGSGADYLYTYLRTFYRDDTRPTGWNNLAFPNVGDAARAVGAAGPAPRRFVEKKDEHDRREAGAPFTGFEQITPGTLTHTRVRRDGRRPGGLPAVDGRAGARQARADRRLGADLPRSSDVFTWRLNASYWKTVK